MYVKRDDFWELAEKFIMGLIVRSAKGHRAMNGFPHVGCGGSNSSLMSVFDE